MNWSDEYAGVTGDVVWDPATNEGYMRFSGLPANDPNRERYRDRGLGPARRLRCPRSTAGSSTSAPTRVSG